MKIELRYHPEAHARDAAEAIIDDLRSRSGLDNAWDEIDEETQHDIQRLWGDLIAMHFCAPEERSEA